MGKSDCFCGLFSSLKKQNSQPLSATNPQTFRDDEPIAMAEAAVSAAQKAIDIAKQTSRARKCHVILGHSFEERAAVVIQARFRSYLIWDIHANIYDTWNMSLQSGAHFGVIRGLFLVVFNATAGASSCYFLSKLFGRPIITWFWPEKLRYFQGEIAKRREKLLNYMLFLRITPTLPNLFINLASPIVDIPFHVFFLATLVGLVPASFITVKARRALRALKSLVKLQALVRGNIVRKQTAEKLLRMQALLRAQSRACAGRAQISESPSSSTKSAQCCQPGPETPEKFEYVIRSNSKTRDQSPMSKKIGSTPTLPKRKNLFHSTHLSVSSDQYSHSFGTSINSTTHQTLPSLSSYEVHSFSPLKVTEDIDESPFCTAENSPHFSRKGPLTPTKSDGSKSCLSGYSDNPSYMASTKSSKAKTRSLSAPKQRPPIERPCSTRRYLVYNYEEMKTAAQRGSAIHACFVNKAYPGSGRLDRLGVPVMNDGYVYRY